MRFAERECPVVAACRLRAALRRRPQTTNPKWRSSASLGHSETIRSYGRYEVQMSARAEVTTVPAGQAGLLLRTNDPRSDHSRNRRFPKRNAEANRIVSAASRPAAGRGTYFSVEAYS